MLQEIILFGRGGQGAVTSASLLVRAALKKGFNAQGFPFFGAERRGAPVYAFVRISDKPIFRHGMFFETDVLIILDSMLIDVGATKNVVVRENGIIIINVDDPSRIILSNLNMRGKTRIFYVDATGIARKLGLVVAGWPVVNTGILGSYAKVSGVIDLENVVESILEYFEGDAGLLNARAAEIAFENTVELGVKQVV